VADRPRGRGQARAEGEGAGTLRRVRTRADSRPLSLYAVAFRSVASDAEISSSIDELVQEEHRLWEAESRGEAGEAERRRLAEVKIALDQCWDLLRQRRALEEFGRNPDSAQVRSEEVVERYQQ
jgi:hypothetical protein